MITDNFKVLGNECLFKIIIWVQSQKLRCNKNTYKRASTTEFFDVGREDEWALFKKGPKESVHFLYTTYNFK